METTRRWYVRADDGSVYGPADVDALVAWARDGRIEPSNCISGDRINWSPVQLMPELEMKWLVETDPGCVFGPFNRELVTRLVREGTMPASARVYRLHEFAVDQDAPAKEVVKEVPVVKEVVKEVPVEKIVEKIVEVVKEVPVERVVEVLPPDASSTAAHAQPEPPVSSAPPVKPLKSLFGNLDRSRLEALERAARQEIAKGRRFRFGK